MVSGDPDDKKHRVLGLTGNPDLGTLPAGVEGIENAPIRLQEDTFKNSQLQRHLKELQLAGYVSVENAVIDIAQNYEQIYEGKDKGQLVLVKSIEMKEDGQTRRGVLLTEFQEVAGAYGAARDFNGGYYFSEIAGKKKKFFEAVGVPVPDAEPEEQTEIEDTDPDTAKSEVVV